MTTSQSQSVLYNVITPVRVASTANVSGTYYNGRSNNGIGSTLTISATSLTIDGVVVNAGNRILLKNQTNTFQNGIYIVREISIIDSLVILERTDDQQSREQLKGGQFTMVAAGTVNSGKAFILTEPLPQNIGVDSFYWVSAESGSISETLPPGYIIVGNSGSVGTAVPMTGDGTMLDSGVFTLINNAITTAKINNSAVTLAKLASGIAPQSVIKVSNIIATSGGSSFESFFVPGALNTDLPFLQMRDNGPNNVSIIDCNVSADTLNVTFSGDPGVNLTFYYQLIRVAT